MLRRLCAGRYVVFSRCRGCRRDGRWRFDRRCEDGSDDDRWDNGGRVGAGSRRRTRRLCHRRSVQCLQRRRNRWSRHRGHDRRRRLARRWLHDGGRNPGRWQIRLGGRRSRAGHRPRHRRRLLTPQRASTGRRRRGHDGRRSRRQCRGRRPRDWSLAVRDGGRGRRLWASGRRGRAGHQIGGLSCLLLSLRGGYDGRRPLDWRGRGSYGRRRWSDGWGTLLRGRTRHGRGGARGRRCRRWSALSLLHGLDEDQRRVAGALYERRRPPGLGRGARALMRRRAPAQRRWGIGATGRDVVVVVFVVFFS